MRKTYLTRAALVCGFAALVGGAAMAETVGEWHNVNYLLKNPAWLPGWSGALTNAAEGVGECYDGAFELYQVLPDLPAGEYTLKATAFQRTADIPTAYADFKAGKTTNGYIFLGTATAPVKNVFDDAEGVTDENVLQNGAQGDDFNWDIYPVPNTMASAGTAFADGKYAVEVKFTLPENGDLRLGIVSPGNRTGEWMCFDNFELTGPNGKVAIPNGDFADGLNVDKAQDVWNCDNIDAKPAEAKHSQKAPDAARAGGVYRKTNASPYNFGQLVKLEAGKYRFGVQSFLRHGNGNSAGWFVPVKGQWEKKEEASAYDLHVAGGEAEANNAYLYATTGWDTWTEEGVDSKCKPLCKEDALDEEFGNKDGFYKEEPIKCLWDEELTAYPDNEPATEEATAEGYGWCDSGFEYQAAAMFVANLDKYRNYVEFELTEPAEVWVGYKKDVNAPSQYWNPFRDFTLEKYVEKEENAVNAIAADFDAPVEYYNLQGVRVANPENGIFIVKKGNKVEKRVIR